MSKKPTFEFRNRRLEHIRRGIRKRWHIVASDGDFIAGFDNKYEAMVAANLRNELSAECHAEITFEVKDAREMKAERFRGDPMPAGNTKKTNAD